MRSAAHRSGCGEEWDGLSSLGERVNLPLIIAEFDGVFQRSSALMGISWKSPPKRSPPAHAPVGLLAEPRHMYGAPVPKSRFQVEPLAQRSVLAHPSTE